MIAPLFSTLLPALVAISALAPWTLPFITPVVLLSILAPCEACIPAVPTVIAVAFWILPLFPDTNTFKKLILGVVPAVKFNCPSLK